MTFYPYHSPRIVFRVDSAPAIGAGHVMRCLALASELDKRGAKLLFVCREFESSLCQLIRFRGYELICLPASKQPSVRDLSTWLGESIARDAEQTQSAISHWLGGNENHNAKADWLIVDHYVIGRDWHRIMQSVTKQLMVIDDLADRHYQCDLLLDQTFGRQQSDYEPLVSSFSETDVIPTLLLGARYALLRTEFSEQRQASLDWRDHRDHRLPFQILVNLGGADIDNTTMSVVLALAALDNADELSVTVVVGGQYSHLNQLNDVVAESNLNCRVRQNVQNMAQILVSTDLVIGAAGSSTWERCTLGIPTILIINADNQTLIANNVAGAGAAFVLDARKGLDHQALRASTDALINTPATLQSMSQSARKICDGGGVERVCQHLFGEHVS